MQDLTLRLDKEKELIARAKLGEDDALKKLCYMYWPLVNSLKRKYHVRYYDGQDWDQDALIVCYESAQSYDANKGRFGSYFKTRLTNHAKTLVRYDTAYRRKALAQSISLETAAEKGLTLAESAMQMAEVPMSEFWQDLLANLSKLEMYALLILLGNVKQDEIVQSLKVEQAALTRARSRLIQKMRKMRNC